MKQRIDRRLTELKLFSSREKARQALLRGEIFLNGVLCKKPGFLVEESDAIVFCGTKQKYVSRGGLKLEKALEYFQMNLLDKTCADIGASTGGFTDCMLQYGAKLVYAIDVGSDQLDSSLLKNPKVISLEKTNFRYFDKSVLQKLVDFVAIDVSFISLVHILPKTYEILGQNADVVALIKPQFEAGKEHIGKKGVVKDPKAHRMVIEKIVAFSLETGFAVMGLTYSPIKGPEGNIEYLIWLGKNSLQNTQDTPDVSKIVSQAFANLQAGEENEDETGINSSQFK